MMTTNTHKLLLAAWWAIAVTLIAAHAWALKCADRSQRAELALESVTIDGAPATDLAVYDDLLVSIYAAEGDSIELESGGYSEHMTEETP